MNRVVLILICAVFCMSCSGKVSVDKFSGIYPGMSCAELESYLNQQKVPFKKAGSEYKFALKEGAWNSAEVTCEDVVTALEFDSRKGSTAKEAKAYIDAQTSLMNAFRDQMITYEEGNKTINLNNGIKLHQFPDAKSGAITRFEISVNNVDGSKAAWEKTVPLLSKIGEE